MNADQSLSYTRTTQSSCPLTQDYELLLTRPLADSQSTLGFMRHDPRLDVA